MIIGEIRVDTPGPPPVLLLPLVASPVPAKMYYGLVMAGDVGTPLGPTVEVSHDLDGSLVVDDISAVDLLNGRCAMSWRLSWQRPGHSYLRIALQMLRLGQQINFSSIITVEIG